jgi:hypothetical protein
MWGHRSHGLLVLAAALSGDAATPPEALALDLILLADWTADG